MARDNKRNKYYTVSLPRTSPLISRLEKDAKERGVRYISDVIAMRLGDYYALIDSQRSVTTTHDEAPQASDSNAMSNAESANDAWQD